MTLNFYNFSEIIQHKPFLFEEYNENSKYDLEHLIKQNNIQSYFEYININSSKTYGIKTIDGSKYITLTYLHHAILNFIIENSHKPINNRYFKCCEYSLSVFCTPPDIQMKEVEESISDLLETGLILELSNEDEVNLGIDILQQNYYCVNFIRLNLLIEEAFDESDIDEPIKNMLIYIVKLLVAAKKIPQEKLNFSFNLLLDNYIIKKNKKNKYNFSDWFWIIGTFNNMSYDEITECYDNLIRSIPISIVQQFNIK